MSDTDIETDAVEPGYEHLPPITYDHRVPYIRCVECGAAAIGDDAGLVDHEDGCSTPSFPHPWRPDDDVPRPERLDPCSWDMSDTDYVDVASVDVSDLDDVATTRLWALARGLQHELQKAAETARLQSE
jgi:hypothetical protein